MFDRKQPKKDVPLDEPVDVMELTPVPAAEPQPPHRRSVLHQAQADFRCSCGKRWTHAPVHPDEVQHEDSCPACGKSNRLLGLRVSDAPAA